MTSHRKAAYLLHWLLRVNLNTPGIRVAHGLRLISRAQRQFFDRKLHRCTLVALLPSLFFAGSSISQVLIPGACRMDVCYETMLVSKSLMKQNSSGRLFEVQYKSRSWDDQAYRTGKPSTNNVPFGSQRTEYVHCSTSRPAVAFKNSNDYTVHRLNPDGRTTFGYNQDSYRMYWVVCHNLLNPVSPSTAKRAAQLGYSGRLKDDQITVKSPLQLLSPSSSSDSSIASSAKPISHPGLGPAFTTTGQNRSMQNVKKYHQAVLSSMRAGRNHYGNNIVEMQVRSYEPGSDRGFQFWLSVNCSTRSWQFLENDARLMGGALEMFGQIRTKEMGVWACKKFGYNYR